MTSCTTLDYKLRFSWAGCEWICGAHTALHQWLYSDSFWAIVRETTDLKPCHFFPPSGTGFIEDTFYSLMNGNKVSLRQGGVALGIFLVCICLLWVVLGFLNDHASQYGKIKNRVSPFLVLDNRVFILFLFWRDFLAKTHLAKILIVTLQNYKYVLK